MTPLLLSLITAIVTLALIVHAVTSGDPVYGSNLTLALGEAIEFRR